MNIAQVHFFLCELCKCLVTTTEDKISPSTQNQFFLVDLVTV